MISLLKYVKRGTTGIRTQFSVRLQYWCRGIRSTLHRWKLPTH